MQTPVPTLCVSAQRLDKGEDIPAGLEMVAQSAQRLQHLSATGNAFLKNGLTHDFRYCIDPGIGTEGQFDRPTRSVTTAGDSHPLANDVTMSHELGHGWRGMRGFSDVVFLTGLDVYSRHVVSIMDEILSRVESIIALHEMLQQGESRPWAYLVTVENTVDSKNAVIFAAAYRELTEKGHTPAEAKLQAAQETIRSYMGEQEFLDPYNDRFLRNEIISMGGSLQSRKQRRLTQKEFTELGRQPDGISLTEGMEIPDVETLAGKTRLMKLAIAELNRQQCRSCDELIYVGNPLEGIDFGTAFRISEENGTSMLHGVKEAAAQKGSCAAKPGRPEPCAYYQ